MSYWLGIVIIYELEVHQALHLRLSKTNLILLQHPLLPHLFQVPTYSQSQADRRIQIRTTNENQISPESKSICEWAIQLIETLRCFMGRDRCTGK